LFIDYRTVVKPNIPYALRAISRAQALNGSVFGDPVHFIYVDNNTGKLVVNARVMDDVVKNDTDVIVISVCGQCAFM